MPHFYNKKDNYILSTNYKVLYSTLTNQKHLQAITKRQHIGIKLTSKVDYYLLVRNPYRKLESFYKDKLVNDPQKLNNSNLRGWQQSQQIFFPHIGVSESSSFDKIKTALLSITFEDFIRLLPNVYMSESHLTPQWMVEILNIKSFRLKIRYKKILPIESPYTLTLLNEQLLIDTSKVNNSTSHVTSNNKWNNDMIQIVNKLYAKDFINYSYQFNVINPKY